MSTGLSEKIRELAKRKFVAGATDAQKRSFPISVRDVISELQKMGIPPTYTPQICSALQTRRFLMENGLEIESVDGPPSKMSPTVIIHYRFVDPVKAMETTPKSASPVESAEARVQRLSNKLRGLLKEEIASHGGSEAFLRWVRGYDEEDAA